MRVRLLEPHGPEVFRDLLRLYPQQPRSGNSTPAGFLWPTGLSVLLHVRDAEQAPKLPVCAGLTDTSLRSLPSKASFSETLFFIVRNANRLFHVRHVDFLSLPSSFPLPPYRRLSEHQDTLGLSAIPILRGISKARRWKLNFLLGQISKNAEI